MEEQGLCYKDGEIIEIEQQPDNSFQISKDLQESEDEKIRKELILFVKGNIQDEESEQRKDYLAWLEKQKYVWDNDDEQLFNIVTNYIESKGDSLKCWTDWLKSIKLRTKKGE